jgi:nucleoside-diphosphate-sugar epimerase
VLHCADCDHTGSASALIAGLSQRSTPSYLIHTSGTGILAWADAESSTYGVERKKIYDDGAHISEVTSLPDTAVHRDVDKLILAAHASSPHISTAIVCPPCIYGPGRGPDNRASVQAYRYAEATLRRGKGFVLEDGTNVWNEVHVRDLSALFLALVTAALQGGAGKATWNDEGYYFAEAGSFAWGDVGRAIAKIALDKGFIAERDVDSVTASEAEKLIQAGSYLWGTNSRCKAVRAREVLGWEPKEKGLMEMLPEIVEGVAKKLGVVKGHAAKAAGEA